LYEFDREPLAVWLMDKKDKDISKRWKLVVAFNDGEVYELFYD